MMQYLVDAQYYSKQSETQYSTAIHCTVLKRENHKRNLDGDQNLTMSNLECRWELFRTGQAIPFIPQIGDKFTVTGVSGLQTWIVKEVDYSTHVSRYRLQAYQKGFGS